MPKVSVLFPTYKRDQKAKKLVDSILAQESIHEYKIYSFVDGGGYNVDNTICEHTEFHGKQMYWKLYNRIIEKVKGKFDYYIYIPDDCMISQSFIDKSVEMYEKSDCLVLNLLTDDRVKGVNWTRFKPRERGEYIQTQWVDMAMIFDERFIDLVGVCAPICPSRWIKNPLLSSGVGRWISLTLNSGGHKIFHLKDTLLHHGVHISVMNEEARRGTEIKNMPIIGGMATFRGREESVVEALGSIINQVDELHLYANDDINIRFEHPKLIIHRHPKGDIGDVGKFYMPQNKMAYYFTFDDDLIYPKDYVKKSLEGMELYNKPISWHGRNLNSQSKTYYKGEHQKFRCLLEVKNNVEVDFCGTGVFAWRKDMVTFNLSDFKEKNMADVFVGIKLNNIGLRCVCLAHEKWWIKQTTKVIRSIAIGRQNKTKEGNQMKYIKELWQQE